MFYPFLSDSDMKALDALKEHHGGAKAIIEGIKKMRNFELRKTRCAELGFGQMIEDAEGWVKQFHKVSKFEKENKISYNNAFGHARSQVSGFQGAYVTHHCIRKMAESAAFDEFCFAPNEMISVVALTDKYVYEGDLLATLTMAENLMQGSKFCSTNLLGTPWPESRFQEIEKVTGKKFERNDMGAGQSALILKNMGTAFGNLGGVEVANDNHLVYLDIITRTALETGGDFYLNPSWSSIIGACYYGRDIPNLTFKVSMLLSTQNVMQFRMLLNIMKSYLREDGTSPIYEINIGNGATAETFIQCARDLEASGIKGVSLAAHIYINPDLGIASFNWTENMYKVLESGTNMTYKYESDGTAREMDTMEAYFLSDEDRTAASMLIGDVIYHKALRATLDGLDLMRHGIHTEFAGSCY
ncbi:hypothetical protein KAR48_08195 [bacterium]|nr:hypothetical protein [bacterium]